jgi:hypothetical protein
MEHALCEPVELTEFELDAVAGGNPFSSYSVFGIAETINSGSFAIGAVQGDGSALVAVNVVGQANTLGANLA